MSQTDRFSRMARWSLAGAVLIAVGSIGYRIQSDRNAPAATEQAAADEADEDAAMVARLEARTREAPDDAAAWALLGRAYAATQRHAEAADAYRRATQLRPDEAQDWAALGEALVLAGDGQSMPAEALGAFRKAAAIDPQDPRTRYFLATARSLSGDHAGAIEDWLALLADTPTGAPWEQNLRRTITQVGEANGIETAERMAAVKQPAGAPVPARGPTPEQVEAAAAMSPAEQRQMAETMVARLEERLQQEPERVDGWLLLIRSRMSMGEPEKARAALAQAVKANPARAGEIEAQARALGVR